MKFLLSIMLLFVCKCAFAGGFYSDYYTPQFYGVSPRGQCLVNGNLCLSNNPISLSRNSVYVDCAPTYNGWIPEWTKGVGCKPTGSTFGGSNPSPPIIYYHQKISDNLRERGPCLKIYVYRSTK